MLIDLPDEAEARSLAAAFSSAGVPWASAAALEAGEGGGAAAPGGTGSARPEASEALRASGAQFLLADARDWPRLTATLPKPPKSYLILLLLDAFEAAESPGLLASGAFDCLLRDGPGWEGRVAAYAKALDSLRRRFSGAFGALERRYEDLVHALPDVVYELDYDGRITFVNNSVRLLGYEPSELAGRHFSVLLSEEDARAVDRDSVLELFRGERTGPALSPKLFNERRGLDRRTEGLEVRLRRNPAAGPGGDILASVTAYGEVTAAGEYGMREGRESFLGSVGVIRDITLRRKSEEMLRKLYQAVDQLSAGVLVSDRRFVVEYANPAFLRITGRSPEEVIGAELFSFFRIAPSDADAMRGLVLDGFDAGGELEIGKAGGGTAWAACRASPVRSPAGDVTHAVAICEDVSQRRAMEELLRVAKEAAEKADRAKSDFLASMSHELKSPVASILAAARLVEMGSPDPAARARSIIASAEGLLGVLGDILDFVRFETGQASLRKFSFPLPGFVARTCEPFRAAAEAKGLAFEAGKIPADLVESDPDRLGRAFAAILDNAVSFTERGWVRVEAAVERREGNAPFLLLSISDSGPGIPPEEQGRVFEPFVQLASPYSKAGGAGIGLSLARNIVRAMGGEVRVGSQLGKGSVFTILVPAGAAPARPGPEAEGGPAPSRRVYRLLVVDDNEVNLSYMATILENAGHRVETASSGAAALALLEARPPDAAVLDIQMPGMSGIELARRIRSYSGERYDPLLPLAALTAFDAEEVRRSSADFAAVFPKPVDVGRLLKAVDEAVDAAERAAPAEAARPARAAPLRRPARAERAEASVPALLDRLSDAAAAADEAGFRETARALGEAFAELGADREEAFLRRLVLAARDEAGDVTACRIARLREAWGSRRGRPEPEA